MRIVDLISRLYVNYTVLWLLFISTMSGLIVWQVATSDLIIDTDLSAFLVRGTKLSNRNKASQSINRYFVHSPNGTYSKPQGPTPPPEPMCEGGQKYLQILLSEKGNILSHDGLKSVCGFVKQMSASDVFLKSCSGTGAAIENDCKIQTCSSPVWVAVLPVIMSQYGILDFLKPLKEYSNLISDDDISTIRQHCSKTGTIPCLIREYLGCQSTSLAPPSEDQCNEPCLVNDIDICELLITTNATKDEFVALSNLPKEPPIGCNYSTEYTTDLISAYQVLVAWSKRSSLISRVVPFGGGRPLSLKASVEKAASREFNIGDFESSTTRVTVVVSHTDDISTIDKVRKLSKVISDVAHDSDLSITLREETTFIENTKDQIIRDGGWAIGSVLFVMTYTVLYSKSVPLAIGAVIGVVVCLPITVAVYCFVFRIQWIGILHLIGLFLIAGIGADDFFVLVAHWRASRDNSELLTTEQRLSWTISHSMRTVAATSLTTAGAFAGNLASNIIPIQLFGLFMTIMMVVLLVVVGLWFPPLLVLHDRWTNSCCKDKQKVSPNHPESDEGEELMSQSDDEFVNVVLDEDIPTTDNTVQGNKIKLPKCSISKLHKVAYNLFEKYLFSNIIKHYKPCSLFCLFFYVVCLVLAAQLPEPSGQLSLWPEGSKEYEYISQELLMDTDVGRADLRLCWGIEPIDTGDKLNPSSKTTVVVDNSFDAASEESQVYFLKICRELENPSDEMTEMVRPGSLNCPVLQVHNWLRTNNRTGLPLPKEEFLVVISEWWFAEGEGGYAGFWYQPGDRIEDSSPPSVLTIWVGTTVDWQRPYSEVIKKWNFWERWLQASNPPPQAANGFHSAGSAWVVMETQLDFKRTAQTSLAVSLALAMVILTIVTCNIALSFLALVCISGSVIVFMSCMTLFSWGLSVIESTCMTIVVGMSCDYVVHICSLHSSQSSTVQSDRIVNSIRLIGPAVLSAAVTTVGAASFLLGCQIVFLSKFGTFVVVTLLSAAFYSLVAYPCWVIMLSSIGLRIDMFDIRCCKRFSTSVNDRQYAEQNSTSSEVDEGNESTITPTQPN